LHIVAVVWHDYKAGGRDVSAMINGVRTIDNIEEFKPTSQAVKLTPMSDSGGKKTPTSNLKKPSICR